MKIEIVLNEEIIKKKNKKKNENNYIHSDD